VVEAREEMYNMNTTMRRNESTQPRQQAQPDTHRYSEEVGGAWHAGMGSSKSMP
jgi:hypothetical protein